MSRTILSNRVYRAHILAPTNPYTRGYLEADNIVNETENSVFDTINAEAESDVIDCWSITKVRGESTQTRIKHANGVILELTQGSKGWFSFSSHAYSGISWFCWRSGDVEKGLDPMTSRPTNNRKTFRVWEKSSFRHNSQQDLRRDPRVHRSLVRPNTQVARINEFRLPTEKKPRSSRIASAMGKRIFNFDGWIMEETCNRALIRVLEESQYIPTPTKIIPKPFSISQSKHDEYPLLWLTRHGFIVVGSVRCVVCENGEWCHVDREVAAALLEIQAAQL